jgi:hypothetical protein
MKNNTKDEIIKGFTHHTINKKGEIKNLKTGITKKLWLGKNGYYYVDIIESNKSTKIALHRLLMLQFVPNPNNKRTVNHKDGNKLNNSLDNLEWATDSENIKHAWDIGLMPYSRKLSEKQYIEILNKFLELKTITLTEFAKKLNIGLTQLTIHLREVAIKLNLLKNYELLLEKQKKID